MDISLTNSLEEKKGSTNLIHISIKVNPRTKKNSQQIIIAHGRPMIIPSKLYKEYEKECGYFLPKIGKPIDYPINLKCIFYMPTRRRVDLCNLQEAVCDMLVHYHILEDDNRNIVAAQDGSRVYYDKDNPHIDIDIIPLKEYNQW